MKYPLILLILALGGATVRADSLPARTTAAPAVRPTPADARAAAALALADTKHKRPKPKPCPCGCSCGTACACTFPGQCGDPICTCGSKPKKPLSFAAGYARAIKENKPLLIWVAQVCPPCEKKMPGYIHVHVKEYQGVSDLVTEPSVVVGQPNGQGGLNRVATIYGCPDDLAAQVQAALSPPRQVFLLPPPPPMPMFGGGFGGGGGC